MAQGQIINPGAMLTRKDIARELGQSNSLVASQNLVSNLTASDIAYDNERTVAAALGEALSGSGGGSGGQQSVALTPVQVGRPVYTGQEQTFMFSGLDTSLMSFEGPRKGVDAGEYPHVATPHTGCVWADTGTSESRTIMAVILPAQVDDPVQTVPLIFTGQPQSPTFKVDPEVTITGQTEATNAGTYPVTGTVDSNHCFAGGVQTKEFFWTIGRAALKTVPAQKTALTFTGNVQNVAFTVTDGIVFSGTLSATNAGNYLATATPDANHTWLDGSLEQKTIPWTIAKKAGSASANKTSLSLGPVTLTGAVNITRDGDGAITASSSNTSVATPSVSGTTVNITGKASGTATITVNIAEGTNHLATTLKITVTCAIPNSDPNKATPDEIKAAAQAGVASNYWSVGDKFPIALSGSACGQDVSGTWYATILGFNHNSAKEGNNRIHFILGKDSAGKEICFVDSKYNTRVYTGTPAFCMNPSTNNSTSSNDYYGTTEGGWRDSYMRKTVMTQLLACFPAAWRAIISPVNKYTSNGTRTANNTAAEVTATSDILFLLAEYEIFGTRSYANTYEQNSQAQYQYYKNGNSRVRHRHSATASTAVWWERSPYATYPYYFCIVNTSGGASTANAAWSYGVAPGFTVA